MYQKAKKKMSRGRKNIRQMWSVVDHLLNSASTLSLTASQVSWTASSSLPMTSTRGRRAAPTNLGGGKISFSTRSPFPLPVMVRQGQSENFAQSLLSEIGCIKVFLRVPIDPIHLERLKLNSSLNSGSVVSSTTPVLYCKIWMAS